MKGIQIIFSLTILTIAPFLHSCDGDENESEVPSELLGAWVLFETNSTNCTGSSFDYSTDVVCSDTSCFQYLFEEGGSLTSTSTWNSEVDKTAATFSVDANELTIVTPIDSPSLDQIQTISGSDELHTITTYSISNSILTIDYGSRNNCVYVERFSKEE